MRKSTSGFTLVELLIVIVVIAILASIIIVAYTGIQGRAHNVAVQSDLKNWAKKIEMYHIRHGKYPASGAALQSLNMGASKSSYDTTYYNLYYCSDRGTYKKYVIAARSTTTDLYYASSKGLGTLGKHSITYATVCGIIGLDGSDTTVVYHTYAYNKNNGNWAYWVK